VIKALHFSKDLANLSSGKVAGDFLDGLEVDAVLADLLEAE
jgi:hypothetical protein